MSAIQADTYAKESTNTGGRPPSASTCGRMAVTFPTFETFQYFKEVQK